jgi:ketosteroid isomerase-like protein
VRQILPRWRKPPDDGITRLGTVRSRVLRCARIWKDSQTLRAARKMNISPDEIRTEVRRFWDFFSRKSKTQFAEMYFPSATVFAVDSRRIDLARLMLVRREREFFGPASTVAVKLGPIDVQLLGSDLAVASYSFHLSITRALPGGKRYHAEVPCGRATQVFQRSQKGVPRILHEHMSSAEMITVKELPAIDPPATDPPVSAQKL